jgi:hypothetical protein
MCRHDTYPARAYPGRQTPGRAGLTAPPAECGKAQREIQQLLDELNVILDSTAALAQTG